MVYNWAAAGCDNPTCSRAINILNFSGDGLCGHLYCEECAEAIKQCVQCEHQPLLHECSAMMSAHGLPPHQLDRLFEILCSSITSFIASGFSADVRPAVIRSTVQTLATGGRRQQVSDFIDEQLATRVDNLLQRASQDAGNTLRIEVVDGYEKEFQALSFIADELSSWTGWIHDRRLKEIMESCRARLEVLHPSRFNPVLKEGGKKLRLGCHAFVLPTPSPWPQHWYSRTGHSEDVSPTLKLQVGDHAFAVSSKGPNSLADADVSARISGTFFEGMVSWAAAGYQDSGLHLGCSEATFEAAAALVQYLLFGAVDTEPLTRGQLAYTHLMSLALLAHMAHLSDLHTAALELLEQVLVENLEQQESAEDSGACALLLMIDAGEIDEPALSPYVFRAAAACYRCLGNDRQVAGQGVDTAAFAEWVLARPELSRLSEPSRDRIRWELGSDNYKRLVECKQAFEAHGNWLAENRTRLALDESAAVEESEERLEDLEQKQPRLGRTIGLSAWGEATAEESELARRIDRVRVKLIEDYRLAIGVEEDDEDE